MVDILLSTYNGEQFLAELLDSLFAQSFQDWTLLVRDDGSKDATLFIVESYSKKYENRIRLISDNFGNVGPKRSFELLLRASSADYVFFCDEDDVWLPFKVEHTLAIMKETEKLHPGSPIVVCTDLNVVDENLKSVESSFWTLQKINPSLFSNPNYPSVEPVVTGCTMVVNRKGIETSLPFYGEARMHDAWITASVVNHGGYLVPLIEATILYRQHSDNQVGAIDKRHFNIVSKLHSLRSIWHLNCVQWKMLRALNFGSILKFLYYRVYFMIRR